MNISRIDMQLAALQGTTYDLGLPHHSQQQLDDIALKLNIRSRKSLDWKCSSDLLLSGEGFDFKTLRVDKLDSVALEH